jgi:hypothetical protein
MFLAALLVSIGILLPVSWSASETAEAQAPAVLEKRHPRNLEFGRKPVSQDPTGIGVERKKICSNSVKRAYHSLAKDGRSVKSGYTNQRPAFGRMLA